MRIKLPKLLVKIMRKRREKKCSHDNGDGNIDIGKKKKVSIFFKSRSRNGDGSSNDDAHYAHDTINGRGMEEATTTIERLLETDVCHNSDDDGVCTDDQSRVPNVVPGIGRLTLSISRSFREMLHSVGNFSGRKISVGNKGRGSFILNKLNVSKTSNCNTLIPSATSRDTNGSRNQKCSKVTPCAPNSKPRSRKIRHVKESARKHLEAPKEEANTMELCKKRILMGRRCRSLNRSGSLQYDEKGILLPEEIIPAEDI